MIMRTYFGWKGLFHPAFSSDQLHNRVVVAGWQSPFSTSLACILAFKVAEITNVSLVFFALSVLLFHPKAIQFINIDVA